MGEVYRATDTKLGRDVALKVLPPDVASDPERNEFRDLARLASRTASAATSTSRAVAAPDSGATRAEEGFWVAVLSFKYNGAEA